MSRHSAKTVWILAAAIVGLVGPVRAGDDASARRIAVGGKVAARQVVGEQDAADPSVGSAPKSALAPSLDAPSNDTCAGAIPLRLNSTTKGTTVGANDDYQTPATAGCYPGIGQTPTTAPGRDVVFSFTAPADGKYSFRIIQQSPNDVIRLQNSVLYLTDCANEGTVTCLAGANRGQSAAFISSTGATNNQSEEIHCYSMTSGQTVYVVFDDASPGACGIGNHACFTDTDCADGDTCVPVLNAGGAMSLEPIVCNEEVEPNDTPAEATPYVCGTVGVSPAGAVAHCYLGTRAGQVCTRTSFLEQTLPNSNMRCSISNARCSVDLVTGIGTCGAAEGICQQLTDLDCDPRCDVGPNAGKTCTSQAFCNPGSDQGATCAGTCQVESTCITAANVNTGVPCTPVCVGSAIPAVNGRYCSALSGCPGGGTCTVTPNPPTLGATCQVGETCSRVYNEGDVDFWALGTPAAGSAIFAGLDAKSSNDYDWRMRITTETETLQFDDDDVTSRGGSNAPAIAGAIADGSPVFAKVSRTQPRESATYELYAHIRPPLAQAQLEDESGPTGNDNYYLWPGDIFSCNPIDNGADNGYVRGTFAYNFDTDCFKFLVNKGDLMDWFGAANPQREAGPITLVDIPQPIIYDAEPAGISNFGFGANPRKNTTPDVKQPTLHALSPAVTSSYFQWRASYTGMLEICYFAASQFLSQGAPSYPNNWSGSMTVNCGPVQSAGPGTTTADVSVVVTGPAGPVSTGDFVDYTITITNNGSEIAQEIALDDTLDPNLTYISLAVDDTLGGNNVACFSLPTSGANDAPIYCINASMAPGSITTYTLTVQVNNCIGDGVDIDNLVTITTVSTDTDPGNDFSIASITTAAAADNGCTDLLCAGGICVPDLCTTNDHCDGGLCVADPLVCDDNSLCTDDSCDPFVGCIFDSSQAGDLCDDFNECTSNACDPVEFCVFTDLPPTTPCDDGWTCTVSDHCQSGVCAGTSVCDDSNACTDDLADELNACACSHTPAAGGTPCSDDDACTGTIAVPDACDGSGTCVAGPSVACDDGNACNGAEACDSLTGCVPGTPLDCDDGTACTTDSCDPALGCLHAPITCDDGDACNGVESCNSASGCVTGTPVVCTALDDCHSVGTCNASTGACSNPLRPAGTHCEDGDLCTTSDTCDTAGTCVGGPAPNCPSDGAVCTADVCDSSSGCEHSDINLDTTTFSSTRIDGLDLAVLAAAWNRCPADGASYNASANLDRVNTLPGACIGATDFHLFMNAFGQSCQ